MTAPPTTALINDARSAGLKVAEMNPRLLNSSPWVQAVAHLDPKYGGISSAVPALSAAIRDTGQHAVSIAAFCAPNEEVPAQEFAVRTLPLGHRSWYNDKLARESFHQLIAASAGVHIHGLWEHSTLTAAHAARNAHKPYLISAHGMLQPWALRNKRWKKVIYGALLERANLQHAHCLHALTTAEVQDYRSYGLTNPIAVIPNGVTIPSDANSQAFFTRFPRLQGKRLILFLSRIHYKKGLDILCQAWASAASRWPDAHLVLAGPDFENTRASIELFIEEKQLKDRVTFTGMLDKTLKWSALRAAECFVLPSYSEGLSVSVLEALGLGLPVIVTRQCNLPEVKQHGCGWVIEPEIKELEGALDECLAAGSGSLAAMSRNGRSLVKNSYSWQVVGQQMSEVYSWMQGGPRPVNVTMEFGGTSRTPRVMEGQP